MFIVKFNLLNYCINICFLSLNVSFCSLMVYILRIIFYQSYTTSLFSYFFHILYWYFFWWDLLSLIRINYRRQIYLLNVLNVNALIFFMILCMMKYSVFSVVCYYYRIFHYYSVKNMMKNSIVSIFPPVYVRKIRILPYFF